MKAHEELGFIEVSQTDGVIRYIDADSIETIDSGDPEAMNSYNAMLWLRSGKLVLVQDSPEDIFTKMKVIQEGDAEPVIGFDASGKWKGID